jgi:aminopeptidase
MDSRYNDLAKVLCGFSIDLKKGQKVLLDVADVPEEFVVALIRAARNRGAVPLVNLQKPRINRELIRQGVAEQFKLSNEFELARMKKMNAYIAVRGAENIFESSDVPASLAKAYAQAMQPTLDWRVNKTKWVVLRWPTASMAQQAKMSSEAFADFFFKVCTLDYSRMTAGMDALSELMMKSQRGTSHLSWH